MTKTDQLFIPKSSTYIADSIEIFSAVSEMPKLSSIKIIPVSSFSTSFDVIDRSEVKVVALKSSTTGTESKLGTQAN